jgi:hypothetical protein
MEIGGLYNVPAALPPGKRPGINRTGGSVSPKAFFGHIVRVSTTLGFDPRTVQRFAIRYKLSRPLERWNEDAIMHCLLRSITTMVDDREVVVGKTDKATPKKVSYNLLQRHFPPTMNKVQLPGNRAGTVFRFCSFLSPKYWTARAKPCPKIDSWTASFI